MLFRSIVSNQHLSDRINANRNESAPIESNQHLSYRIRAYRIESAPIVANQHQSNRISTNRMDAPRCRSCESGAVDAESRRCAACRRFAADSLSRFDPPPLVECAFSAPATLFIKLRRAPPYRTIEICSFFRVLNFRKIRK